VREAQRAARKLNNSPRLFFGGQQKDNLSRQTYKHKLMRCCSIAIPRSSLMMIIVAGPWMSDS
jgi:hypothetical protein